MNLTDVNKGAPKHKNIRRVGRGPGSGQGKTAGRGQNGAKSRSGWGGMLGHEGGQMPIIRRLPKKGFNNSVFRTEYATLNVRDLEQHFADGDEVTLALLKEKNLAKHNFDVLKILGDGELTKKLKVHAHRFSKSATEKITAAGGEVVVLPGKKPVVKNKMKQKN